MKNPFRQFAPVTVQAHCDVPCGIYDPSGAVLAAKTVARMVDLITQAEIGGPADHAGRNKLVRCIAVKEEHAEKVKREVQVIWSDYFKPEHLEKYPNLHDLVWKATKEIHAATEADAHAPTRTCAASTAMIASAVLNPTAGGRKG